MIGTKWCLSDEFEYSTCEIVDILENYTFLEYTGTIYLSKKDVGLDQYAMIPVNEFHDGVKRGLIKILTNTEG